VTSAAPIATALNTYFTVNCHAREDKDNGDYTEITVDGTLPKDNPAVDRDWNSGSKAGLGGTGAGETGKMHYTYVDYHPVISPTATANIPTMLTWDSRQPYGVFRRPR
jgi:hypothetical protein